MWTTDRGTPNGIVKLDPRNVKWEHYPLPERGIPHGITVDSKGIVWWGETVGFKFGRLDPKTGKMDRYPIDPPAVSRPAATIRSSMPTTTSG